MAPSGRTARCRPRRWRHARRNLHLSEAMRATLRRASPAVALLAAVFLAGIMCAQDKPDRPPWAQPKPKLPPAPSSTDATAPVPPSLPQPAPAPPPPGSIVPTPEEPLRPPEEDKNPQRGKIKVKVELVNILASVLDEHNKRSEERRVGKECRS